MMSEKDRDLIKQGIIAEEWQDVSPLEEQAESDEAKKILHARKMHLYHREEHFAGIL